MTIVKLRQSGGSTIVTIPRSFAERLGLNANRSVEIDVIDDALVIKNAKSKSLKEMLALCDLSTVAPSSERVWLNDGSVGMEEI